MSIKIFLKKALSLTIIAGLIISNIPSFALAEETEKVILSTDAIWSISDVGQDLGTDWLNENYDYSSWKKGKAPFGFGDAISETNPNVPLATEVSFGDDENNKYITTYAKTEVNVDSLKDFEALQVYVHADDGTVVYVNGQELFRRGIDESVIVDYNTPAKFSLKEEKFTVPVDSLKEGKNVISAEVHQDGGDSSDLWFEMSIAALKEAPEIIDYTQTPIPNPNAEIGEVSRVVVSFKGDIETSKGFTWYTTQASANSDLQIIEKTDNENPSFENALTFKGNFQRSTNAPQFVVHKAQATGLKKNTEYQFRVGDADLGLWSKVGTFETADKDGKFTFIDLADSQAKSETEAVLSSETFEKAFETVEDAQFMMLNGDIVDSGSKEEQWGWLLDHSDDTLLNTTFVAAAGNHDDDPESFIEHFNIDTPAGSSTKTGAYFSFDYENAHFIVLNNNEDSEEFRDFTPEQIEWLKADVKAAKANNGIDWVIAVTHKGPYTTSNHATDDDIMGTNGVREKAAPLFSELGIDLILQGHDHIYARTLPIKDGEATVYDTKVKNYDGQQIEYAVNPDGTIYLIPSTAGPKVYYKNAKIDPTYYDVFAVSNEHSAAKYGSDPSDPSRPVRSQIQNFVEFSIDGKQLTAVSYEIDQSINNGTPYAIDTFGIIKNESSKEVKETPVRNNQNIEKPKASIQIKTESIKSNANDKIKYTVISGDVLWKIADKYGVTYQDIQMLNEIGNPNLIYPGQVLVIPSK